MQFLAKTVLGAVITYGIIKFLDKVDKDFIEPKKKVEL